MVLPQFFYYSRHTPINALTLRKESKLAVDSKDTVPSLKSNSLGDAHSNRNDNESSKDGFTDTSRDKQKDEVATSSDMRYFLLKNA